MTSPVVPPSELPARRPRQGLVELLAQQVTSYIRDEHLLPGGRLPSVQALARHFAVGAPTVREALRRLEATGMIEIRHGSGTYVRQTSEALLLRNPLAEGIDSRSLQELLDARLLIEPALAERAAELASDEELHALRAALDAAASAMTGPERDDRKLHEANMRFHRGVALASRNLILAGIVTTLIQLYDREQQAAMDLYGDRARDHQEHEAILEALNARDSARCRAVMAAHLQEVKTVIDTRLNGGDDQTSHA